MHCGRMTLHDSLHDTFTSCLLLHPVLAGAGAMCSRCPLDSPHVTTLHDCMTVMGTAGHMHALVSLWLHQACVVLRLEGSSLWRRRHRLSCRWSNSGAGGMRQGKWGVQSLVGCAVTSQLCSPLGGQAGLARKMLQDVLGQTT